MSRHWPDETLYEFLYEGTRQAAIDCPVAYGREWEGGAVAGQRDYTLPTEFLPPLWSVVFDYGLDTERELRYMPPETAPAFNTWHGGTPAGYTLLHKDGALTVRIMPTPTVSTSNNILVHCAGIPSTFYQACPINPVLHDAVVSYAKARAWEEWEQWDYCTAARSEYESRLARARRLLGTPILSYPLLFRGGAVGIPASERND